MTQAKYYSKQKRDRPAKRVNIYLDEETHDAIRDHATWCGKSISEWIEKACLMSLQEERYS